MERFHMSDKYSAFDLDLNAFDKTEQYPDWPELSGRNGKIAKAMYNQIMERFGAISAQLDRGVDLHGKDRKIIASKIATDVGKNANYLTKREFPRLHECIAYFNERLARKKVIVKGRHAPKRRLSVQECAQRIEELEAQLDRLMTESLIESAAVSQLGAIRKQNISLKAEIEEMSERLVRARRSNSSMTEQISELLSENLNLRKIIIDLGGDTDPASPKHIRKVK